MQYLVDLDQLEFADLAMPMTEQLELVDHRLYNSLVDAARSATTTKYHDKITSTCRFGCGRQALRALDKAHNFEATLVATKAGGKMIRRKCKTIRELEEYVQSFRVRDKEMTAAGMPLHPTFTLELLEIATEGIPELAALFKDQSMRESSTTEQLLDRLEAKVVSRGEVFSPHRTD